MSRATAKKSTAWGDAEGRRRDILSAARAILQKSGHDSLNMRDVAVRARVSPGTLYVYFKTKEEIFLTLYAARVDEFATEAEALVCRAESFEDLFTLFAAAYLRFYEEYGHALSVWSIVADENAVADLPRDLVDRLRAQVTRVFALAGARARELAAHEGRTLRDDRLAMPFVWAVLTGLADNFSGPRAKAATYDWDEMVRFAARTLREGLTI
jgi:AcrR family transcriptional regulator